MWQSVYLWVMNKSKGCARMPLVFWGIGSDSTCSAIFNINNMVELNDSDKNVPMLVGGKGSSSRLKCCCLYVLCCNKVVMLK